MLYKKYFYIIYYTYHKLNDKFIKQIVNLILPPLRVLLEQQTIHLGIAKIMFYIIFNNSGFILQLLSVTIKDKAI